ncbi:ABC transporter permease [Ornithinimicrobium sp. Y1847]|uniref:ABC transporter permease n=1 Tax=Ornithinimicrobium sp. Y1847 TaxID=3405419 RepID=UPI003B66B0AD
MSPTAAVLSAAWQQAKVVLIRKYTSFAGVGSLVLAAVILGVLWFIRDADFGEEAINAGVYVFTGFLAFGIIAAAVMGVAGELQTEREDGTLLRAKAVPHGMTGHLIAKLIVTPFEAVLPILPVVVGATLLLPGVMPTSVGPWLLLVVVFLLAVAAMMPWGAILGSIFRTMLGLAWAMIALYAVAFISGLFFPVVALPTWLQWMAQATPIYWIGSALRMILLPEAGELEFGGEYRVGLTLIVLLGWAIVGMALAPVLLRRMARRQSGSQVAAARDRLLSRGY